MHQKQRKKKIVVEGPEGPKFYNQKYNSSDTSQLLGLCALREQRALDAGFADRRSRASSYLASMGKIKMERKLRAAVPDAFKDRVPETHSFTCESVFESLLRGEFSLLYSLDGRVIAAAAAAAAAVAASAPVATD